MARKLKSDKVLFMATLLLVFASVVMVFSASAYINAFRYEEPHRLLVKQALWAALGVALLGIVMRIDYRVWRHPVLIMSALGVAGIARRVGYDSAEAFSRAFKREHGDAPSVRRARRPG